MSEQPSPSSSSADSESIANDILRGAKAISVETGDPVSKVYKDFEAGKLAGAWKDGGIIHGSRRAMRRAYNARARIGK